MDALRLDVDLDRLADVRRFIREAAPPLGADTAAVADLVQAVDEWVTNVVVHGYRGAGGPVEIALERDGRSIVVRIRDAAPAFDPATAPAFHREAPLGQRPLGGMGIYLIRELSDRFEHRALDGGGNEIVIRHLMRNASEADGRDS